MIHFVTPDNQLHYIKEIELQKRGDTIPAGIVSEFSIQFKRNDPDPSWDSYDSNNHQLTGQLLTDSQDLKRIIKLDKTPVVGREFKISFYDPDNTGSGSMSVRIELKIQKLALNQQEKSFTLSSWWDYTWRQPRLG